MILDLWFLFGDGRSRKRKAQAPPTRSVPGGLSGSSGASLAQSSLSIGALTHLLLITKTDKTLLSN